MSPLSRDICTLLFAAGQLFFRKTTLILLLDMYLIADLLIRMKLVVEDIIG